MADGQENLPDLQFKALSLEEREESRLNSRDQEDKLSGTLLHICSWNPDADNKLNAGVNFSNILQTASSYESAMYTFCTPFLNLSFVFVFFGNC